MKENISSRDALAVLVLGIEYIVTLSPVNFGWMGRCEKKFILFFIESNDEVVVPNSLGCSGRSLG